MKKALNKFQDILFIIIICLSSLAFFCGPKNKQSEWLFMYYLAGALLGLLILYYLVEMLCVFNKYGLDFFRQSGGKLSYVYERKYALFVTVICLIAVFLPFGLSLLRGVLFSILFISGYCVLPSTVRLLSPLPGYPRNESEDWFFIIPGILSIPAAILYLYNKQ